MLTSLRVTTPPTTLAVSIALAQQHCRIDTNYDDALLAMYISAATAWAESFLNRALLTQTLHWTVAHNRGGYPVVGQYGGYGGGVYGQAGYYPLLLPLGLNLGHGIELPRAPLQSVAEVRMGCPDGTDYVLDPASDYSVDINSEPGRVHILQGSWFNPCFHNLQISYSAGYGNTPAAIPAPILQALLLHVAFSYEQRGDVDASAPAACEALLWPYRMVEFA